MLYQEAWRSGKLFPPRCRVNCEHAKAQLTTHCSLLEGKTVHEIQHFEILVFVTHSTTFKASTSTRMPTNVQGWPQGGFQVISKQHDTTTNSTTGREGAARCYVHASEQPRESRASLGTGKEEWRPHPLFARIARLTATTYPLSFRH